MSRGVDPEMIQYFAKALGGPERTAQELAASRRIEANPRSKRVVQGDGARSGKAAGDQL